MKTPRFARLAAILVLVLCGLRTYAAPRNPAPIAPENAPPLLYEGFDEYYSFGVTNSQIAIDGFTLDESWSGYALDRSGASVTPFTIPALASDGETNISSDVGGALRFWLQPFYSSQSSGGTPPGANRTLLELDAVGGGSVAYAWSLDVSADGNTLALHTQTADGVVTALELPISWQAGECYNLALDYYSNSSALFIDGSLAATGTGVPSVPDSLGLLVLGSQISGADPADAAFDEFFSFGDFLTTTNAANYYLMTASLAAMGPYYSTNEGVIGGFGPQYSTSEGIYDPNPSTPCNPGGPVYLTNFTASVTANGTLSISFIIQGGVEDQFYDVYRITDLDDVLDNDQWTWISQGFTCNAYTVTNQPAGQAYYKLVEPSQTTVWAWGDNSYGQCDVPPALTNAVAVAAGTNFSLALTTQGTIVAWGDNSFSQTNVPAGLTNVIAISAGMYHGAALLANGRVTNWGYYYDGSNDITSVTNRMYASAPPSSGVVAISSGIGQDVALLTNGSLVAWGYTNVNGTGAAYGTMVPANLHLTNVTAIACGGQFNVALSSNGVLTAWGYNGPPGTYTNIPSRLSTNIAALAASWEHSVALMSNGTVVSWGFNDNNDTNVPTGLTNVVTIAAGAAQSLALQANGTVVEWGATNPPPPTNMVGVKAISCGYQHNLAISSAGLAPLAIQPPPLSDFALPGKPFTFSVTGVGTTNVNYQWQFNGVNIVGATNATYTITNTQSSNAGTYTLVISNPSGSATRIAVLALVQAPQAPTNAINPAASQTIWINSNFSMSVTATNTGESVYPPAYQWQLNGTNLSGATNSSYNISSIVPASEGIYSLSITNVVGSTNVSWTVRLAMQGMAEAWGDDSYGESDRPASLTNVAAIAAGELQSVAVTDSATVAQWGQYSDGTNNYSVTDTSHVSLPPANGVVSVSAGLGQALALMTNGTVKAWGISNVLGNSVPANLGNVTAVACGWKYDLAISNGCVIAWGDNTYGQCNVPVGITTATAIAAGPNHALALLTNGIVVAWGQTNYGATNVPSGLSNVVGIAAGNNFSLALRSNGTIVPWGIGSRGATNIPVGLSNVMAIAAGDYFSLALKNDGTLVSWGDNVSGQAAIPALNTNIFYSGAPNLVTNVPNAIVTKLIAAGGDHTMASIFSPLVQYPINISKDLLLIYNSNSLDSSNVCQYYLTNRPMVAAANLLGVNCTTAEGISWSDYTNTFSKSVVNWLSVHPTLRPEYLILFQDLPSRVTNSLGTDTASVQFDLHSGYDPQLKATNYSRAWTPLVTGINMNSGAGSSDCIGYINKIVSMASNNPIRSLVISGRKTGYLNTNFCFDGSFFTWIAANAKAGISNLVPAASITFTTNSLINVGTNVAAYWSAGADGSLDYWTNYDFFPTNGILKFYGQSGWYAMATVDSFNGQRDGHFGGQASFITWFGSNAFFGTNYSNTPIGGISHVDEPSSEADDTYDYYRDWVLGKTFIQCAWAGQRGTYFPASDSDWWFQSVGDPFVKQ